MPDELPASVPPQPEARETVVESVLPAPELEALFAALESSPIRIKPETPEPVPEPIVIDIPAADAAAETPFAFSPAPVEPTPSTFAWTGSTPSIALTPIVPAVPATDVAAPLAFEAPQTFDAPRTFDAPHTFDAPPAPPTPRLDKPRATPEIAEADHVSAAFDLQASFTSASEHTIIKIAPRVADDPPVVEAAAAPVELKPLPSLEPLGSVDLSELIDALPALETAPPAAATPDVTVAEAPIDSAPAAAAWVAPEPIARAFVATAPATTAQPTAKAPARQAARWRPLVTAVATVVILAAIGVPLSRLWLERAAAQPGVQPAAPQPAPAAHTPTPATARTPAAVAAPATVSAAPLPAPALPPATTVAVAPPRVASADKPRSTPLLSPDALVAPRPVRPAAPAAAPPQPAPSLTTFAPAVATPNVSPLPAATAEAAPEAAPAAAAAAPAPAPAAGPFFELNDVDGPPKVTARVDAVLPAALDGQALNEIVVVRVLVSQTGRPALVSLLRHSKAGLALDEAVIAAVKQWTFTPATKHGRSVSCFYHVAFQVSQR